MSKRFVIYNEEYGVYLGSFIGLGFWSTLDPAGQKEAPTFDADELQDTLLTWALEGIQIPGEVQGRLVHTERDYASIEECVHAGLPRWEVVEVSP